jgi:N utilization substance protein A
VETIFQSIEMLSKEKGIDSSIVLDAVKDALLLAAKKHFRTNEDYVADLDSKSGAIKLYAVKKVVDDVTDPAHEIRLNDAVKFDSEATVGADVRIPKPTDALGRISAQTAKQVIFQKVREAERETVFNEYSGRAGELVNCTVKRIEGQDLVLDLGKTEARLPKKEQSRLESFTISDRVRCVIKIVDKASKGPGVVVSRADAELVKRLFEQEVPEIYDSTVIIKGCAREAGERTKIAVQSRDRDVDCVGACVGMKGMRVQSIIRELRGEKIDIIEYSEDPVQFATHALSPAKISRVTVIDPVEKHMEVIVDDSQLSLAIGKKGQNVRLAAKLIGWKVDIKSEEEKRQEVQSQMEALTASAPLSALQEYGLEPEIEAKLMESGINSVEKLGEMTPEQLQEIPGIGSEMVEKIQLAVINYYGQYEGSGDQAASAGEQEAGSSEGASLEGASKEASNPDAEEEPLAAGAVEEPEGETSSQATAEASAEASAETTALEASENAETESDKMGGPGTDSHDEKSSESGSHSEETR